MILALNGGEPTLKPPYPTWPKPDEEVHAALECAWTDGSWGRYEGAHNERLIGLLSEMHGVRHVLPCSSGTIAVELALRGLHVGTADEVILAGYDFSGNFRAIESVGARPVLVDIAAGNWCLAVDLIRAAVTPQTRAVIVSHLHGGLTDMRALRSVADQHQLAVIEDACQSPGAVVQGQIAGSWGDVAVLSFGGSKLLTAGRGGAMLTNRAEVYQRAKVFCERGNHAFPLSELQAAVLPPQFAKLAERNLQRRTNVQRLVAKLDGQPVLRPVSGNPPHSQASYYKVALAYSAADCGGWPRDRFLAATQAEGVPLDSGFRGFTRRGARCRQVGSLEHSRRAAEQTVLLHHPVLLEPPETMDLIAAAIQKVVASAVNSSS